MTISPHLVYEARGHAASPTGAPWREGLKLIGSASPADVAAAESILEQANKKERLPPAALAALALCHLRQESPGEALAVLAERAARYSPEELESTRGTALRIALVAALMKNDAAAAELAFKDLVRLVVAEKSDSLDLRLAAHAIGSTVAMLEADVAKSPIPANVLAIGTGRMLQSNVRGVEAAYQAAYAVDNETAVALVQKLELIATKGFDVVAADNAARLAAVEARVAELNEQKKATSEIIRNTQEQIEQNKLDQRKLSKEIASLTAQSRAPTPGHPGPRPLPPTPPPRRNSIAVEQYETRTDYENYYRDGQQVRVPVTRQVRRPQYEIDRERDAIFDRLIHEYDLRIEAYRRVETVYQNALASWTDADKRRRSELSEKRAELEARRTELVADSQVSKDEKNDSARALKGKRTAQEQEQFELQIQSLAINAFQAQKIHTAFRPPHYTTLVWPQEKVLLQRYSN